MGPGPLGGGWNSSLNTNQAVALPPAKSGTSPASAGALAVQTRPIRIAARLYRRIRLPPPAALEIRRCCGRHRIGVVAEIVDLAGGAAPLDKALLHAPRALGDLQRLDEDRRILDQDFSLEKTAAFDQAIALDHVQLFAVRGAEVVHE